LTKETSLFSVADTPIKNVSVFTYLGHDISNNDDKKLHGSSRIAHDRQVVRAIQGGHRQRGENEDAMQSSGGMHQVQANLGDTNNTSKIS